MRISYLLFFLFLLLNCYYANAVDKPYSQNCVYENSNDSEFIPSSLFRINSQDINLDVNIGETMSESYFPHAPESLTIVHCKKNIELKWVISAKHYKDNIFETGIPEIGFKLISNGDIFSLNKNIITVKKTYINNCNYQKVKNGYDFRYCQESWNGIHLHLVKIGELDLSLKSFNFISPITISAYLDGKKYNNTQLLIDLPKVANCKLSINEPSIHLEPVDKDSLNYYTAINEKNFSINVDCKNKTQLTLKIDSPEIYKTESKSILALLLNKEPSGSGLLIKHNNKNYILGSKIINSIQTPTSKYIFNFSVGYIKINKKVLAGKVHSLANVTLEYD